MGAKLATHHSSERPWYRRAFRHQVGIDSVRLCRFAQTVAADHAGIRERRQAEQLLPDRITDPEAVILPNAAHDLASPAVHVTGE